MGQNYKPVFQLKKTRVSKKDKDGQNQFKSF